MNDRALRDITVALGGPGNGYPREDGFDIVVASEIMAIFCLATDLDDMKERLGRIVIGYTRPSIPSLRARKPSREGPTVVMADIVLGPLVPVFGVLVLGALMARGLQDAPRSKGPRSPCSAF